MVSVTTYSYTEAGDALFVTLCKDRLSGSNVVRLPISDDHQHLGSAWSTAIASIKTLLTVETVDSYHRV